jgi:hypothetical protein
MPRKPGKHSFWVLAAFVIAAVAAFGGSSQAAPRGAPALASPGQAATLDAVPAFEWRGSRKAAKYEFQLAADSAFESIVLGQGRGSFQTRNTFATIDETLPNGDYFWRVRRIGENEDASPWSATRLLRKRWDQAPQLISPVRGEAVNYPSTPLVLRWNPVPRAYKYLLWIGTDPSLASADKPIETSATVFSPPNALGPGRYYWAVTPIDAQKHLGRRSAIGSFVWRWPSRTSTRVVDLNSDPRVLDPQFTWNAVPGAASYEVEVNPSQDFATGSKVCCNEKVVGTSLSPKKVLPNNTYYWRMRAIDLDGQAGDWNYGTPFRKWFDDVAPSIPNLHVRDHVTNTPSDPDPLTPQLDTGHPIITWSPVPGASSYQVQIMPHTGVFCDWTGPSQTGWKVDTAATSWTPLATNWNGQTPGISSPSVATDSAKVGLQNGVSYCVRVLARSDRDAKQNHVLSEWTQIRGIGNAAFKYVTPTDTPLSAGPNFTMPSTSAYLSPVQGSFNTRLPLFTWRPITGAGSYFVVIARDADFTHIVDVALTNHPMYAPRKRLSAQTYPDETTAYYWAVVPAAGTNGSSAPSHPTENLARAFQKRSVPPTLLTPANGSNITTQPVFRWSATEGARDYLVQVARDAGFSDLVDEVTTAATSYTSEGTYPADTVLYWRVRANDENRVGLTWSQIGAFRRRLPIPRPHPANPTAGETIPVLRWSPVEGATSYDVHIDQADGTRRDLRLRGTALTAIGWYGTGIWHWQVRANFPSGSFRETHGGYSAARPFARRVATPANLVAVNSHRHLLLGWSPAAMAKNYRVEISTTDSFTRIVDRVTTDHTNWAPRLTQQEMIAGGRFWWRVAAADEGGNLGGWRVGTLKTAKGFLVSAVGYPRKRGKSVVRVSVRDGRLVGVRKAKVVVKGAGTRRRKGRTNKDGIVELKVRPKRRGMLKFRVTKRGFRAGSAKLEVH